MLIADKPHIIIHVSKKNMYKNICKDKEFFYLFYDLNLCRLA